jgi:hypothetical protein
VLVVGVGGGEVGGGDVGGGVLDGAGGCVTGVGGCVAGVGACVGMVAPDPAPALLEPEVEPCVDGAAGAVVPVTGAVAGVEGAVVDVAPAAPAMALTGIPLFNTANQTWPTFWPCACPFFLSPSNV